MTTKIGLNEAILQSGTRNKVVNTWDDFDNEAKKVDKFTREQEPVLVQLLQDAIGLFADAFSIGHKQ